MGPFTLEDPSNLDIRSILVRFEKVFDHTRLDPCHAHRFQFAFERSLSKYCLINEQECFISDKMCFITSKCVL